MNEFGPRGGRGPGTPLDPPMLDINEMKHQRLVIKRKVTLGAVPYIWVVLSERCTRRCNSPPGGATRVMFVSVAPSEGHLPVQYDTYNLPRVYSQAGHPWVDSPKRGQQCHKFTVHSVLSKFNSGYLLALNLVLK